MEVSCRKVFECEEGQRKIIRKLPVCSAHVISMWREKFSILKNEKMATCDSVQAVGRRYVMNLNSLARRKLRDGWEAAL